MSSAISLFTQTTWPWVAAITLLSLAIAVQRRRKYARLPPGPTPLPIIGNILDFPRTHLGREFAAYTKQFGEFCYLRGICATTLDDTPGDVLHFDMLGKNIIVLGSLKAARDLLDKRSANYSDRPTSVMLQLCVNSFIFIFTAMYSLVVTVQARI